MAYLNLTTTTKLPEILRRAYSEARVSTSKGNFLVGSSDTDSNEGVVEIVNECQREFFDLFTMLNQTSGTVTVTAGSRYSDLPTDLRDSDILQLTWANGPMQGRGIPIRSFGDIPLMYQSPDTEYYAPDGIPAFAYLPPDNATKIAWHGLPGADLSVSIRYRTEENQFTTSDLVDSGSSTVCSVPDRMIPVLTLMIAIELSDINHGGDNNLGLGLSRKLDRKVNEWLRKLGRYVGADANEVLEYGGLPAGFEDTGAYGYNDIL